jgi:hypothetical protein
MLRRASRDRDTGAAERLDYLPVGSKAQTVVRALDRPVDAVRIGGDKRRTVFDDWLAPSHFDYGAEDAYMARTRRASGRS